MVPVYPVEAGIRSNIVLPQRLTIIKITKEPTEADIGHLHISFLRIQVECSSNTKKYLKGKNGVTEADIGHLRISFLRIQVRRSSLRKGYNLKQNNYMQIT